MTNFIQIIQNFLLNKLFWKCMSLFIKKKKELVVHD